MSIARETFSAQDVALYLGLSKTSAYKLMRESAFPSIRIGGKVMVTKAAFERWLDEKQGDK